MKQFKIIAIALTMLSTTACSDFFSPDTEDQLNGSEYISSNTEMYTGFLGIMTKLQAIGDKEILLTDTRADMLEPTDKSTPEIIALYNYDDNLQNNSYADPAGYYEVVIACNDYIEKMKEYRKSPQVDDEVYQDLIASAGRIKVWAYKTIGEIYGQAIWFDDPITKVSSIADSANFTKMDMPSLVDKCLSVMDNGIDGVSLTRNIDWIKWLDPDNITSIASSSYRKWNSMVPPYEGLYAELCLWKGAVLDSKGTHDTKYYKRAADLLLKALNVYINDKSMSGTSGYFITNIWSGGQYKGFWDEAQPKPQQTVAALIYDYTNNQTNTLLKHFSTEYPNNYLLRPSTYGMEHYTDPSFNPGATDGETRTNCLFKQSTDGYYIAKFRPIGSSARAKAYQDDVHIYLYRANQYHIMLAEALNNLNRFKALNAVLNVGVKTTDYSASDPEWEGFTQNWTSSAEWGTRSYPSAGIRGQYNLTSRSIKQSIIDLGTVEATRKYNDEAILDEIMIEFSCEGKTYPAMNRMALRYNDLDIIADRIAPKYKESGKDGEIRSKIEAGGNYVKYDLKLK